MKINSTSNLTIQADQELRAASASPNHPTATTNGFAVALFVRRSEDLAPSPEAGAEAAPGVGRNGSIPPSLDLNTIYKCKNCGKRMKLSEATSYYGLPACPACVQACAPFEIVPESSDSTPNPPKNL
jgi:hypothetical protein